MGLSLSDLNPFKPAKKILKKVAKPFRKASKFIPKELRWAAPYLSAAVPFMLPGGFTMAGMNPALSRGIMSSLANIGGQAIADPEGEDINLLSTLLAGGVGALGSEGMGARLQGGIERPMAAGPQEYLQQAARNQSDIGFLQGAENLGREGLAQAADYLSGSAEGLASLGKNPASLFSIEGAKAAATDIAPILTHGTGDVSKASTDKYRRAYEAADLEEQRQMDETTTADETDRAYWSMRFMREAGHDEETVKETLAQNNLEEYYEPPVEEEGAAQGGIIGLKHGGRIGLYQGGGPHGGKPQGKPSTTGTKGKWSPSVGRSKKGYLSGHPAGAPATGGTGTTKTTWSPSVGRTKTGYLSGPTATNIGDLLRKNILAEDDDISNLFAGPVDLSIPYHGPDQYDYSLGMLNTPSTAVTMNLARGGIIGLRNGGMLNLGGNEMDYRGGGFVPIGKRERADDVPARLSKNEFVMTADAVKAAGGGSVNKGAQRMYNVMNNLEARA